MLLMKTYLLLVNVNIFSQVQPFEKTMICYSDMKMVTSKEEKQKIKPQVSQ